MNVRSFLTILQFLKQKSLLFKLFLWSVVEDFLTYFSLMLCVVFVALYSLVLVNTTSAVSRLNFSLHELSIMKYHTFSLILFSQIQFGLIFLHIFKSFSRMKRYYLFKNIWVRFSIPELVNQVVFIQTWLFCLFLRLYTMQETSCLTDIFVLKQWIYCSPFIFA